MELHLIRKRNLVNIVIGNFVSPKRAYTFMRYNNNNNNNNRAATELFAKVNTNTVSFSAGNLIIMFKWVILEFSILRDLKKKKKKQKEEI